MMESTAADPQRSSSPNQVPGTLENLFARISVADGLYLLILLAAAIMRLAGLGAIPLSPLEAPHALASWQFLRAGAHELAVTSPAYSSLTGLLMNFFGVSDVTVRLVPAVFGIALVALPWLLRDRIGKIGVLATAALFSASPLLASTSRSAGGDAIALFAILLLFIAIVRLRNDAESPWRYLIGGALGLGITSSPLFYTGFFTMAIAWLAQRSLSPQEKRRGRFERRTVVTILISAALTSLAVSTRLLMYPAGIGASAQLLGDWLAQFGIQGGLQELIAPFLALGRYEVVLLPLGIAAVIWAVWRNHPLGTFFTSWLLAAMILILLQRGFLANALLMLVPAYLLLGVTSQELLQTGRTRYTWIVWAIVVISGAVAFVNVARFLRVSLLGQQVANLWIAMMAFAVAILSMYYFWSERPRAVVQGVWLGILFLLLMYQWGTGWNLTHTAANDPRENWITSATDDDIFQLVSTLRDISRSASNSDGDIPVFSAVNSPVLRWYLRDFDQAQFGQSIPPAAQYEIVISSASVLEPTLGSDYLGTDFGLLRSESDEDLVSATPLLDGLRWALFHESPVGIHEESVILWVRSDLAGASAGLGDE